MRAYGKAMLVFTVVLVGVGLMTAQQPFQIPFGMGKGGLTDPLALLRNASVKKELKVTDEQVEKLPEAVMKALSEVLDKDQLKRLKEIELQQKSVQAFKEANVQSALKMTSDQKDAVNTILEDSAKEQREVVKELAAGGDFKGIGEKVASLRKEASEKVMAVLTTDQKKTWKQMVGAEFKIEFPAFGKGFFKKKDDNQSR